eukprot:6132815-Pyramimonas_sp.AAC.1
MYRSGCGERMPTQPLGSSVEFPYGATKVWRTHANTDTGAFEGAPYGAATRVRVYRNGRGGRVRTPPLEPSVAFPMRQRRNMNGAPKTMGADACKRSHHSRLGHETCE